MKTEALNLLILLRKLSVEYIDRSEISIEVRPWEETPQDLKKQKKTDSAHSYSDSILNQLKAKTEVKDLGPDIGYGLFATESIKEGEFIGEYTGVVRPISRSWFFFKKNHYPTDYAWDFPGLSKKGKPLEIDSRHKGNETRFINHSFRPNIVDNFIVIPKSEKQAERRAIFFTAIKPINKGEQILVNYGEDYWVGGRRELVLL